MASEKTAQAGASLSDVAYLSRMGLKFGAIFIVFLMVGRVVLNAGISVYKALNPPKPPGPTMGFGTLPPLVFPKKETTVTSYALEAPSSALQITDTQMRVFFMPVKNIHLFSTDQAKKIAAVFGFLFPPEEVSKTVYRWKRTTPLSSVMEMDIVQQTFSIKTDWASDPSFLIKKSLPSQQTALIDARLVLKNADLMKNDIATSEPKFTFLKANGTQYQTAASLSDADFLRLDIYRTPILGKYPVYRPNPAEGNAIFVYSGSNDKSKRTLEVTWMYYPIEYDRYETYPIISASEAWTQLQEGKGFVANVDSGVTQAVIRKIFLGYYDSDDPQHYLQPVYVFVGDKNFYAYVPAIRQITGQTTGTK